MKTFAYGLLAAALMASPLAMAQRVSLADRVAALEQRAAGDQNATELVNQITQLSTEVQNLRGQIEELQQQLEQAKQSQRAQYLDLSGRLDRLEGGSGGSGGATAGGPAVAANVPPARSATSPEAGPVAPIGGDEQSAYDNAFDAMKNGDYVEAARRLRSFLDAYPDGQRAPNALYWLGESYYVTQNYELASAQFRALLDRGVLAFTVPSAFTTATGRDHWEILLRARAIENQAFVLAANQTGKTNPQFDSWGHSMIVGPWGEILAEAGQEEGFVAADLDLAGQAEIRSRLPAVAHRRPDVFEGGFAGGS